MEPTVSSLILKPGTIRRKSDQIMAEVLEAPQMDRKMPWKLKP